MEVCIGGCGNIREDIIVVDFDLSRFFYCFLEVLENEFILRISKSVVGR